MRCFEVKLCFQNNNVSKLTFTRAFFDFFLKFKGPFKFKIFCKKIQNIFVQIEPPPPKKSKKGEKETSQQKKMSDRARQKLMQRNRRLPDLKMAYTEYFKEMARFASDYNMTEILENMTSLTLRDIEIDMN